MAAFFLGQWRQDVAATPQEAATPDDDEATPAEVLAYFEQARSMLTALTQPQSTCPKTWREDLKQPFIVGSTDEEDFGALMLIVARSQPQHKRAAPIVKSRPWYDDPAAAELLDAEGPFLPIHHLVKADTWLPGQFAAIEAADVPERTLIIGSVEQLASALSDAERLLRPGSEAIRKLAPAMAEGARRAHAALTKVVAFSLEHGTPILIDA